MFAEDHVKIKGWAVTFLAMGLGLSAQAKLTHRYNFEDDVNDVVGTMDGGASTDGLYVESPQYVADTPAGATGPTNSLEAGMNVGTKKPFC